MKVSRMTQPARNAIAGTLALAFAGASLLSTGEARSETTSTVASNKALVQRSFEAWSAGTGGPYDLLRDDARWEIVGRSAASKTYPSREAFLQDVIRPFNARMKEPLKPVIREIHGEGDTVVILFDASGVARDGQPYTNTYSWYLRMENGQIVSATAFFDSIAFNDLWSRVNPE